MSKFSPMAQLTKQSRKIETNSFAIIDNEMEQDHGGHDFSNLEWPIVRRAIHTTADFEYAKLFRFSKDAVPLAIKALRSGAPIITDVTMIVSGLNKARLKVYNNSTHCFISDPYVITQAKKHQQTRALWGMRRAQDLKLLDGAIIAIGNGPTALLEVLKMCQAGMIKPAMIIGIPVGFVMAQESKDDLLHTDNIPFITSIGRKGGSPIVVACIHALLAIAAEQEKDKK